MINDAEILVDNGHVLIPLSAQPSLNWAADGDEFIDVLRETLAQITETPVTGSFMNAVPFEWHGASYMYRRYEFSGPTLATTLAAIPLKNGNWSLALEAADRDQANSEESIWAAAISKAQANMGKTKDHSWWAVVAPTSPISGALVMDHSHTISQITLKQPVSPYARYARVPGPRGLGGGGNVEIIYPIAAQGASVGYSARVAMRGANDKLMTLCAALTLDTDVFWEIIEAPQPFERTPGAFPSSEDASLEQSMEGNWEIHTVAPSAFAEKTIAKMHTDSGYTELVAAYYHARTIEQDGPSLAAVIYVSLVEAIGARFVPLTKCDCCEQCTQHIGYAKQFREAMKLVLQAKAAKRLGQLYSKRSTTAHQGTLHGTEFRLRSAPNTFAQDPAEYFLYQNVWQVRAAACYLLRLMVEDLLPPMPDS